MKHLLALLLTLFLAFPAIAMPLSHDMIGVESVGAATDCHGKPLKSPHHNEKNKSSVAIKSDCIGCATPSSLSRSMTPEVQVQRPDYTATPIAFSVAPTNAPEPPPPRSFA